MPGDVLQTNYPLLVRALANIVLCYVPEQGVWFTTMERGHYGVEASNGEAALADLVIERLVPLATARLVIDNEFRTDLEPELWDGDEIVEQIKDAGRRMGDLDLLPAPFPIEELLDERDLRQVKRLYGIGGLSYGNLSARKDERRFWMSASGVDKSKLEIAGPRHPAGLRLRRGERADRPERAPQRRAAARVGRRDRALDDLPGAPRRGRHPPRPCLDGGHPGHGHQLSRAGPRSWRGSSPTSSRGNPTRNTQ